jgi:hypothetical protein
LDPRPFPNPHPFLNFDKRSDKGFIINLASVKVDRLNHGDVLAEFDVGDTGGAKVRLVHDALLSAA